MDGAPLHTGKAPDSDFEVSVMEALHQAGFESEAQVGVAGFFIDLAVKDPGKPGRYLMGIECDGATYHSAKSARDRDRLRQEVLERLGWRIRRIWSTDWYSNPQGELEPIIRELHGLKTSISQEAEVFELDAAPIEEVSSTDEVVIDDTSVVLDSDLGLREQLETFGSTVIAEQLPDTPKERRLLRPAMIEALVEHEPVSASEFVELVPEYLRKSTEPQEARLFLNQVLDIVAGSDVGQKETSK
jgi:very-short-patch-repair endonuclease